VGLLLKKSIMGDDYRVEINVVYAHGAHEIIGLPPGYLE